MARGKKKESALTPEEKLAQALVPVEEQPYNVPQNWVWSFIRFGYEVTSSKRVHKDDWISEGIPFYRTRELVKLSEQGYVDNELFISEEQYEEYKSAYGIPKINDLLISGVGTIGVPYIVDSEEKFYFKDGNIIWFKNKGLFLPKYIYYLYKSLFMDNQIHEMSSGTTVDTYTIINANNTKVPVPPIAEQQRIVDRIECLFAKLDEAKETAQSVLGSFETRKAAILHKAFTGELTAKWRVEHGENLSAWQALLLGDIGNWGSGGTPSRNKPEYFKGNIPWVKTGELNDGYIYQTEEAISEEAVNNSSAKKYPKGTVLIAMYGATIGKCAILGIEATTNQACACAVPDKDTYNRFLFYYLLSQKDEFIKLGKGGAQPNISQTVIKQYPIKRPTLNEQQEIVCILDSLFAKEQQAKEAAEAVLEKIDLLKKSILACAFRGELGTNDPSEKSALELLKQVLQEDTPTVTRKRSNSIPKDLKEKLNTELERSIIKLYFKTESDTLPVNELLSVSSKKFEIMNTLRLLEQRNILTKLPNGKYRLLE